MSRYLIIFPVLLLAMPVVESAAGQLTCREFMENELTELCRRPKESYVAEWQARNPDVTQKQRYYFMLNLVQGWRDCQKKELDKRGYKYSSYYPIQCSPSPSQQEIIEEIVADQASHSNQNAHKTSYSE